MLNHPIVRWYVVERFPDKQGQALPHFSVPRGDTTLQPDDVLVVVAEGAAHETVR